MSNDKNKKPVEVPKRKIFNEDSDNRRSVNGADLRAPIVGADKPKAEKPKKK